MNDFMKGLREQALEKEKDRKKAHSESAETLPREKEASKGREVARFFGVTREMVDSCCGSICPNCEMFLDKAIALEELGYTHHLFMNPTQEDMFAEVRKIFRKNHQEYNRRRQEFMERMRR